MQTSSIEKFLKSQPETVLPLKISVVNASDKEVQIRDDFTLGPYNTYSCERPDLGEYSKEFFANCDAQILDLDLLHSPVYTEFANSILVLVATNSTSHHFVEDVEFYTFVHLYHISFGSEVSDTDFRLLALTPVKNDHCLRLKWLKINFNTGCLFAVYLFKSGSVKIGKLRVDSLNKLLSTSSKADRVLEVDFLWEFSPNLSSSRKITSFDVSYNVDQSLVTLACGSNDGFLELWDFSLSFFQTDHSAEDVDHEGLSAQRTIPVICGVNNSLLYREITDLSFLPLPNSYVLAVGTFSKGIILWDTRFGHTEGELKTYHNILKPINSLAWSYNYHYLLGCTSTGIFIDWQNKQTAVTVSSEKLTKGKSSSILENICWGVASSDDSLFFVFDNGENLQVSTSKLGRKNAEDSYLVYKWKLSREDSEETNDVYQSSDSLVESLNYSMKKKFLHDLSKARSVGVTIFESSRYPESSPEEPKTLVRNKVLALNTVRSLITSVMGRKTKLMAYGGNLGLLHLVLTVVDLLGN